MSNQPLIQIVQRIERLNEEAKATSEDIKSVYLESKSLGYDAKVIRALIKKRAADAQALKEFEETLALYENAIQQILPLGETK